MKSETILERVVRDDVNAQMVRLELFLELLERIFHLSAAYTSSTQLTLLLASILKVQQSGNAVRMLAQADMVEEILALGQTLVELTVNVCYLQGAERQELERYLSFHPETGYRYAGMLQASPSRAPGPRWKQKLSEMFSFLGPKSEPGWTQRTLAERAQISDEHSHIPVMSLLLSRCHARGDAAVHGTMGVLDSFVEMVQAQRMAEHGERNRELADALFGINLTIMSFSLFLDEYLQLGMHGTIDAIAAADSSTRQSLAGWQEDAPQYQEG